MMIQHMAGVQLSFFLIMMILAPLVQDSWNAPSGVG